MILYIVFSYLFVLGIYIVDKDTPIIILLLAPIIMPMALGAWICKTFK
jgi:hypothetical protein